MFGCSIQREQHEQMQKGIMNLRGREWDWKIIGKEGLYLINEVL